MLEEHVRNINDGFLFRRELRTHRSVGGDGPHTGGNLLQGEEGDKRSEKMAEQGSQGPETGKAQGSQEPGKRKQETPEGNTPTRKRRSRSIGVPSCTVPSRDGDNDEDDDSSDTR